MEKDKGSKQFTLKHLEGKDEAKDFKELFSNSKKKKRVERKKTHKNSFTGSICSCILMMASVMY